ncbi:phosphotransferase [Streptomyces sp. NPDC051214]|uniref:phosphotransferase n=1 Tax=Streptomyces sp. NPDC051214 TaxID=3155282 RepID=UPI003434D618
MTDCLHLPSPLAFWAEQILGPVDAVYDASHARETAQVWQVVSRARLHYLKVAPTPVLYSRETRSSRQALPSLAYGNARPLVGSSADMLSLMLTAVDGEPVKSDEVLERRRAAHRKAGQLLRRFHPARPDHRAQKAAGNVIQSSVAGLGQHIEQTGDHPSAAEAATLRRRLSALPDLGLLPCGWRQGDFWERNRLGNGRRCALLDFERNNVGPLVAGFVKLALSLWPDRSELREALLKGYGRRLSQAEEHALTAFAAADADSALPYGPRYGDPLVTARGHRTTKCLMQEDRS